MAMSVLAEALSVIVPRERLAQGFPGGVSEYRSRVPNRTYCEDDNLTRVGFMTPDDVHQWLNFLGRTPGLTLATDDRWIDVAVVDQFRGPTAPCEWLEFAREAELSRVWLHGLPEGALSTPAGWVRHELHFMPNEVVEALELEPTDTPGVETFTDPQTGRPGFVRRGIVRDQLVGSAWGQALVDEVEGAEGAVEHLLLVQTAQGQVEPIAAVANDCPPEVAIRAMVDDLAAKGDEVRVSARIVPISVGVLAYGTVPLDCSVEDEGDFAFDATGPYLLATDTPSRPFFFLYMGQGHGVITTRRLPSGLEGTYQALGELLVLLQARAAM